MKQSPTSWYLLCACFTILAGTNAHGSNPHCPNELISVTEVSSELDIQTDLDLGEKERVTMPFQFIAQESALLAPTITWEDDAFEDREGDERRSGGILGFNPVSFERTAYGHAQSNPIGMVISPTNSWMMALNWRAGPWTVHDLSGGNMDFLYTVQADQSHRFEEFEPEPTSSRALLKSLASQTQSTGGFVSHKAQFSSFGEKLLVTYPMGDCFVLDAKTGRQLYRISLDLNPPADNQIPELWDAQTNRELDAAFSADGKYIATVHQWGAGAIWDVENGQPLVSFAVPRSFRTSIPTIHFSPYQNVFVTQVAGPLPGTDFGPMAQQTGVMTSMAFWQIEKAGGRIRFQGQPSVTVKNLANFMFVQRNGQPGERGSYYLPHIFTPDNKLLMATADGNIRIYNLTENPTIEDPENTLSNGHNGDKVSALAVGDDNHYYASGSDNGLITIWSTEPTGKHYQITGNSLPVRSLDFSSDSRFLFVQVRDPEDKGKCQLSDVSKIYRIDTTKLP